MIRRNAVRIHEIAIGHRVVGHENKCRFLHGHNLEIHFSAEADRPGGALDAVGRVVDFGVIKERMCQWLEDNWDHKFLLWREDPFWECIARGESETYEASLGAEFYQSFVAVPFNPTSENMADYLLTVIAPERMRGTGARICGVKIGETSKCAAISTDLC